LGAALLLDAKINANPSVIVEINRLQEYGHHKRYRGAMTRGKVLNISNILLLSFILAAFRVGPCFAVQYQTLNLDLAGDGHLQTVSITLDGPESEYPEFEDYTISLGKFKYLGHYFANSAKGELGSFPNITPVILGKAHPKVFLLVSDYRLGTTVSNVLGYKNGGLSSFLTLTCDGDGCSPVTQFGYGIAASTSMNFWFRRDIYKLNPDETGFTSDVQKSYSIVPDTAGYATVDMPLKPADCKFHDIKSGMGFQVMEYDPSTKLYLLKGLKSVCGWTDALSLDESSRGLPWGD